MIPKRLIEPPVRTFFFQRGWPNFGTERIRWLHPTTGSYADIYGINLGPLSLYWNNPFVKDD